MTPEEKFNQEIWYVLQEIKEEQLYNPDGYSSKSDGVLIANTIPYSSIEDNAKGISISPEKKEKVLRKLQERKAIKIMNGRQDEFEFAEMGFILHILQPKFDEIYEEYEKANEDDVVKQTAFTEIEEQNNNWLSIIDALPQKIVYETNDAVETLINFIEKEKEAFDHETDDATKPFIINIPPVGIVGSAIQDFETQKFLVFLLRQKIISDLYLPVYIRRKNQKIIEVRSGNFYFNQDVALSDAIKKPDGFQKQVVKFKVVDWDGLMKIKEGLGIKREDEKFSQEKTNDKETQSHNQQMPTGKFTIAVKDREIWINSYLVGKPHAVGSNFEFFEYIRRQKANTKIEKTNLPDWLKKAIGTKRPIKILNALGFKGEIKKAFFYKVGKNSLYYKGDKITIKDCEDAGVKIPLFLKELETAHTRNSPE